MEGVEFEQDKIDYRYNNIMMKRDKKSSLATWLIKKGVASNEGQINVILLIVSVVAIAISIFLLVRASKADIAVVNLPDEIIQRLQK